MFSSKKFGTFEIIIDKTEFFNKAEEIKQQIEKIKNITQAEKDKIIKNAMNIENSEKINKLNKEIRELSKEYAAEIDRGVFVEENEKRIKFIEHQAIYGILRGFFKEFIKNSIDAGATKITVNFGDINGNVYVEIRDDNTLGFDPTKFNLSLDGSFKIFERISKKEWTKKIDQAEQTGGMGMGLSLVKLVSEFFKGTLEIKNYVDEKNQVIGTGVLMRLPSLALSKEYVSQVIEFFKEYISVNNYSSIHSLDKDKKDELFNKAQIRLEYIQQKPHEERKKVDGINVKDTEISYLFFTKAQTSAELKLSSKLWQKRQK